MSLAAKKAIVTGASEGIGRGIVEGLLKKGASVLFTGRDEKKLQAALRGIQTVLPDVEDRAFPFVADACDPAQAESTARRAYEILGSVDILVNNVGGPHHKMISECVVEDFERDFGRNFASVVAHIQTIIGHMKAERKGVIINISSVAAQYPVPNLAFYSPAKAALEMYTRTLASEVGKFGVRVKCVCPGPTNTRIFEKTLSTDASGLKEGLRLKVPLQRLGRVEDIAEAVVYLASDEASWITGSNLIVDGGRTVFSPVSDVWASPHGVTPGSE